MAVSLPKGQGVERLRNSESSLQEFRPNVRFANGRTGGISEFIEFDYHSYKPSIKARTRGEFRGLVSV